jgi:hypothetical protein
LIGKPNCAVLYRETATAFGEVPISEKHAEAVANNSSTAGANYNQPKIGGKKPAD